nr:hypothetical protein [Tanacetum cinerariifolium]
MMTCHQSSTPLRDIIVFELPSCIAITPILFTKETKVSLITGDKHLNTIPEKESDEFIKSSVENLVPNLSESKDKCECDVPVCDDFTTFSNLLFDAYDDFSSSDNRLILFLMSSPMNSFFSNQFHQELMKSTVILRNKFVLSRNCCMIIPLLNPLKEINSKNSDVVIKSFSPSPIPVEDSDSLMEEIDLSPTPDDSMPPGIKNDDYKSEGDILILEELLSNDSLSLPENESFHFDIPSSFRRPTKPPDDDEIEPNSEILTVKVVGDISEHYVLIPRLLPTQTTLASNQEKSSHLLSHRGLKAFQLSSKSPMMIVSPMTHADLYLLY